MHIAAQAAVHAATHIVAHAVADTALVFSASHGPKTCRGRHWDATGFVTLISS